MARAKGKQKKHHRSHPARRNDNGEDGKAEETAELPYAIQQSEIMGRYLVAARDMPAGQLILHEAPLVVGPSQDSINICIGCYSPINGNIFRCKNCAFPLCSSSCPGACKDFGHSQSECDLLSTSPFIKLIDPSVLMGYHETVAPLRCLVLQETDPVAWKILFGMEAHTSARKKCTSLWSHNQENVVNVIRNKLGILKFDEDIIHHVCGVLEVNSFEVGTGLRGLYPTAYLFAHDCVPNTKHADDQDFNISFWTTVPIMAEAPLNVTYTFILQGTLGRRKHLLDTKFFECKCQRCRDPNELGTNISALKCPMCRHGLVQSSDPLNPNAHWICCSPGCPGYVLQASGVSGLTNKFFCELDSIDGNDIPGYEHFLAKCSDTLHDSHYLCLSAMHCLFQLYGKIDGYLINNLSEAQTNRKIELCRRLLDAFDILEPGLSKQRGIILYELQAPLMILLQRNYQERRLGKKDIKGKLREITKYLEESKKILDFEASTSQEHEMAAAAANALESLNFWRDQVNKM